MPIHPPTDKIADTIKKAHADGKDVSYICGVLSTVLCYDVSPMKVRSWHKDLMLVPNADQLSASYKERQKKAVTTVREKPRPAPRPNLAKTQPVAADETEAPINIALRELRYAGRKAPATPLEIIRAANRLRKGRLEKQLDKCAEWVV